MQNIEKLFSKPLPSTRKGAFYNTFPYPTKISPEAIAVYIASATNLEDTVLDAFAGSGSTGIAALLAEHPTEKMIETASKLGVEPVWGRRKAVLYEIGTYAAFATRTITNRLKAEEYANAVDDFIKRAEKLVSGMYIAKSPDGKDGFIRYAIWTEVLVCPECKAELDYFKNGTSRNPATFFDKIECPHCHKTTSVSEMSFATEEYYDKLLAKPILRKKRKIAWIYGTSGKENWDRTATEDDSALIQELEESFSPSENPRRIEWGDLHRAGYHFGISHLHHFYTNRNYQVMSKLWKLAECYPGREADALKLLLLSYNGAHCTLMTRVVAKHGSRDFVLTGAQSGVLYISKLPVEKNILIGLKRKAKPFKEAYKMLENCHGTIEVRNISSETMAEQDNSIDFVFTDPPFGDFIPYAEVNQINELWLPTITKRSDEVVISASQNKGVDTYRDMLTKVFREIERVTKDDHPIAIVFHAAKAAVWGAFSEAIQMAGLEIQQTSFLDKTQVSFKQVVSKSSVQGDPMFLLKKAGFEKAGTFTEDQILQMIVAENPHETPKLKPYGLDDDDEAEVVKRIFSMYMGGLARKPIAQILNQEHIPNRRGTPWKDYDIRRITMDPAYRETLIDPETFDAAQEKMEQRTKAFHYRNPYEGMFAGIITCGVCGRSFSRRERGVSTLWVCREYMRKGPAGCDSKSIRERLLKEIVTPLLGEKGLGDVDRVDNITVYPDGRLIVTIDDEEIERVWR